MPHLVVHPGRLRTVAFVADRKKQLGQFFTRDERVHAAMCDMVRHGHGRALEPSAGEGHLAAALSKARPDLRVEAVELDPALSWPHACIPLHQGDFFVFADSHLGAYDVIFGNPPYVSWKACDDSTKRAAANVKKRYQDKANLYYLFIDRCLDLLAPGGELVFIVPAEWAYTTTAQPLRSKMAAVGALTHVVHCGEEKLFSDAAVPAIMIFRFVAGQRQGDVTYSQGLDAYRAGLTRTMELHDRLGRWMLLDASTARTVRQWGRLGDQYAVRVGLVTGADAAFKVPPNAKLEPECLQAQVTTKQVTETYINVNDVRDFESIPPRTAAHLLANKSTLLARRIAAFDDTNWWRYGAIRNEAHMASDVERFYALAKTRSQRPFFTHAASHFTGGVLGLFRKPGAISVPTAVAVANSPRYRAVLDAMFLITADKVSLQPSTLEDSPFPQTEAQAAEFLASS